MTRALPQYPFPDQLPEHPQPRRTASKVTAERAFSGKPEQLLRKDTLTDNLSISQWESQLTPSHPPKETTKEQACPTTHQHTGLPTSFQGLALRNRSLVPQCLTSEGCPTHTIQREKQRNRKRSWKKLSSARHLKSNLKKIF